MDNTPAPRDVFLTLTPKREPKGHEQAGPRPMIVIARPAPVRFPMIIAVPLTTKVDGWQAINPGLSPVIESRDGGLIARSAALMDHLQCVDEERLVRYLCTLTDIEMAPIHAALRRLLTL